MKLFENSFQEGEQPVYIDWTTWGPETHKTWWYCSILCASHCQLIPRLLKYRNSWGEIFGFHQLEWSWYFFFWLVANYEKLWIPTEPMRKTQLFHQPNIIQQLYPHFFAKTIGFQKSQWNSGWFTTRPWPAPSLTLKGCNHLKAPRKQHWKGRYGVTLCPCSSFLRLVVPDFLDPLSSRLLLV
jgi:hypothetical protein